MSKIAILLPNDEMVNMTNRIIEEEKIEDVLLVKKIGIEDSVHEARMAVSQGAEIIISRGAQASYIKHYTNVPLVEIALSGQEIGLLVKRAIQLLNKSKPTIALIGFENMFMDTSYFNEIFDIDLHVYYMKEVNEAQALVEKAKEEHADIIIGGMTVNRLATEKGIQSMFYESKEESIKNALYIAAKMLYATRIEKSQNAQFETVLGSSFTGIVKINREKEITIVNHMTENLLGKKEKQLMGAKMNVAIPQLEDDYVEEVLEGKRENYTTSLYINGSSLMVTVAPIRVEKEIAGAIISFYRLTNKVKQNESNLKEMILRGYSTHYSFSSIIGRDAKMKECIEMAKLYAISSKPVLIYSEPGTEKEVLAQCIHTNSVFSGGPFVSINCSGMTEEMQIARLFGNPYDKDPCIQKGVLVTGNNGTVLISDIDALTPICQHRLFQAIKFEMLIQNDIEKSVTLNNRIIVSSKKNLLKCVQKGEFREDLFYLLNGLVLEIPPLRERPKDVEQLIFKYRERASKQYSKYIQISEGAMNRMKEYSWPGNELQLESFCERLFITNQKRVIAEDYVQYLLDELYPSIITESNQDKMVIYKNPKIIKIQNVLDKHGGNRAKAAEELGISTTTLWRYMKKYGILDK